MTAAVTRQEPGAVEPRREAARCRDARAARRTLALALVLEGSSREEAARPAGMDRQTLRDWVHRDNGGGPPGPARPAPVGARAASHARAGSGAGDRRGAGAGPRPGPPGSGGRTPTGTPGSAFGRPRAGPVVRWRRVDLRALIEARSAVRLHERSVGKVPRRLGFARLSVRPKHPKADEAAQEAFKKASPRWSRRRRPSTPAASRSRSGSE